MPDSGLIAPDGLNENTGSSAADNGRRFPLALEKEAGAEDDGEFLAGKTNSGRGLWVSLIPDTLVAMAISGSRKAATINGSIRNSLILVHGINCVYERRQAWLSG